MTLKNDDDLRDACDAAVRSAKANGAFRDWGGSIRRFIEWYRSADEPKRATEAFQRKLWDENPVSSAGQGNVSLEPALTNVDFRTWLAHELTQPFPESSPERRNRIVKLFDETLDRVSRHSERKPRLKLFRVMAVAFPRDFTTISYNGYVTELHRKMFDGRRVRPLRRHFEIMDRLEKVVGPTGDSLDAQIERMILPWLLYEQVVLADAESTGTTKGTGEVELSPLPAARRRPGLSSIRGGFQTVLAALDFVEERVTRQELIDHLRTLLPGNKDNSLSNTLSVLRAELGVIRSEGDQYVLTERGETVLESGDASDLSDWLLTKILGVDAAVATLRDQGPLSRMELTGAVRACNPRWKTDYVPGAIVTWLRSFGVIEDEADGRMRLSQSGRDWAARIYWTPERLPPTDGDSGAGREDTADTPVKIRMPDVEVIVAHVSAAGQFEPRIVRDLHAGLWGHARRHFAILAGLSGTGKTLLAKVYAESLWNGVEKKAGRLCIVTVQPGWHDPGALLGYVNPLQPEAYVRTPFLEFLLQAGQEPAVPYVALLDEMNLSHPEQYLAPILSAMETGAPIDLHREGEEFDGIPPTIAYPSNLAIIGTVNMDETTHGISDKVLDRAFTQDFWQVDVPGFRGWKTTKLATERVNRVRALLVALYDALSPARLHFGWRTIDSVLGFLEKSSGAADDSTFDDAIDSVVYAKILPKLRGDDSPRFRKALEGCFRVLTEHGLERCASRVGELKEDLESSGTARFWR